MASPPCHSSGQVVTLQNRWKVGRVGWNEEKGRHHQLWESEGGILKGASAPLTAIRDTQLPQHASEVPSGEFHLISRVAVT